MFHMVKFVAALPDFILSVQFNEGVTKIYDVKLWFDKQKVFHQLFDLRLFYSVKVDMGGFGISWNDEVDLHCNELWNKGIQVQTPFDNLLALSDATRLWGLNESTLRKAISYGKLINGVDVMKFGKQWVITRSAMEREYGLPKDDD